MPFGALRSLLGRCGLWGAGGLCVGVCLACSAPDGSSLYRPFGAGGSGASGGGLLGGSGGSGGGQPGGASGAAGSGGASGGGAVGDAGASPLAGAGGEGASGGAVALDPDAGTPSAADSGTADAAPPPGCEAPAEEICDGLDNDCDGQVDPGATCPSGCVGFTFADSRYVFCADPVEREVALAACAAQGLKLAWLESPEENAAVIASVAQLGQGGELLVQIGASDAEDEDEWLWIGNAAAEDGFQFWDGNAAEDGGEPVDGAYQNWADGEPNDEGGEDCGVVSVNGSELREPGQWDDRACDDEQAFLCEAP